MMRDKEVYERKTLRPKIDKGAAKRFIRHGLYDPNKLKDKDILGPKRPKRKIHEIWICVHIYFSFYTQYYDNYLLN